MFLFQAFFVLCLSASTASGFAFFTPTTEKQKWATPTLSPYSDVKVDDTTSPQTTQTGTLLDLRLDIGSGEQDSRMSLQGLIMELSPQDSDAVNANKNRVVLPGADGPVRGVSAGAKHVDVRQHPFFIGMKGKQTVPLLNGCWEIMWPKKANSGVLICGFDLKEKVERNEAYVNPGLVYLYIPVWTREGLKKGQENQRKLDKRVKVVKDAKAEAVEAYLETNNIVMKAYHYFSAARAMEKLSFMDHYSVLKVPFEQDVVPLGDNLFTTAKGKVWTMTKSAVKQGANQGRPLGSVNLRQHVDAEN